MLNKIHMTGVVFAAIYSLALPVMANDLETICEDVGQTNGSYLCATALDFGGQAAHLRDLFLNRHHGAKPGDDGFTIASSGTNSAYTGVFSAGAQVTAGNFSGNMQALVIGADRALSDGSYLGVMLQFGQSEVTAPGSPRVTRDEILIGPYFAGDFGNELYLDGYLLFGQPDYTVNNLPSNGESITGAFTLSKGLQGNRANAVIYSSLAIKREEPTPAQEIDATILTLGGSLRSEDRRISNGWRQNYARFEVDIGSYVDNLGTGTINYLAPRITVGTDIAFDNDATLNLMANASLASDQTYIFGLRAAYNLRF